MERGEEKRLDSKVSADVYSVPHMENVHDIQVEMSDRSQEI